MFCSNARFKDQVIWITGASSGIGEALAYELGRHRARLILSGRRADELARVVENLNKTQNTEVLTSICDVSQDGDPELTLQAIKARFGRLDICIANAGYGVVGKFERLTLEDYRRQFETNVWGVIRTSKAALPELQKTQGQLVIMGSVAGYVAPSSTSPYSMSKFAVRAFAEALYYEERKKGVAVTLLSPGWIDSNIRRVDNQGRLHADIKDPMPSILLASTNRSARAMVRAIACRRKEAVITPVGKLVVWVSRFAPWLLNLVLKNGFQGRPEPKKH